MTTDNRAAEICEQINKIIFAEGAPLGSDSYFKIRQLCTGVIRSQSAQMPAQEMPGTARTGEADRIISTSPEAGTAEYWEAQAKKYFTEFQNLATRLHAQSAQEPVATVPFEDYKLARDALMYWKYDCTGVEPSLSVFNRMVDDALSQNHPATTAKQGEK